MSDDPTFSVASPQSVVSTELGEGLALLDLRNNQYFTLDAVGAFIWDKMRSPQSRRELIQAVIDEYETTAEDCAVDVDTLLEDLTDAALIEAGSRAPS